MKKILIVEDDFFLANAYRVKLTKSGFEIKIAANGDDALTALQTFFPDVIVLDLVMPGKDGFSLLSTLKTDPKFSKIPILVASNLGQEEDLERAKQLGADDYIVKSDLSLDDLVGRIQTLFPSP